MAGRCVSLGTVSLEDADTVPESGTPQYFTNGDVSISRPATAVPAYFMNMVLSELRNMVVAAGIAPTGSDWQQCWQGVIGLHSFMDTGAANAVSIASRTGLSVDALYQGQEITIMAAASNTDATTLTLDGLTHDIRRPNGNDLEADDIIANRPFRAYFDGSNWIIFLDMWQKAEDLDSPLLGIPGGVLSEVFLGYGLAMSGNVLYVNIPSEATPG